MVFSTDEEEFGGQSRIPHATMYHTEFVKDKGLGFYVYTPCRTAMVFKRV